MLKYSLLALILGFVLDLRIGDPRWLYHPVCVIGNLITVLEKAIRKIFPNGFFIHFFQQAQYHFDINFAELFLTDSGSTPPTL